MSDYTIYPIYWPSGVPHGTAWDLNDAALIVGDALAILVNPESNSYLTRPFVWHEGDVTLLEALDADHGAGANAVNGAGQVVGYSGARASRWSNGSIFDLQPMLAVLGFENSVANDINDAGIIVGDGRVGPDYPLTPQSRQVWVREGNHARNLSAELGQNLFWGHAINNQGQITGAMYTEAGKLQAYVYDLASNQLTVLASENHGIGWDINDDGIVVGEVGTPGAAISQGGSMVSIGSLSPGQSAIAYGINSSGRVAGYSHLPGSPHLAAFVYASGVMTRLDTVTSPGGWQLDGVTAINASHWMVALGRDPRGDFTSALVTPEGVVPPHAQHPLAIDISDIARAVVMILFGVTQDGGGAYIGADGKLHHVGPGPGDPPPFWQQLSAAQRDLLIAAAVNRLARGIDDTAGRSRIEAAAAKLIRDLTPQIAARTLSESRGPRSATPRRGRFDPRRRQQEALRATPPPSTPRS